MAVPDFDHLRDELVQDVAIVADDHDRAGKAPERFEQGLLGYYVEVVGRLVEQQAVVAPRDHLGQRQPRAFAARQHADALLHFATRKQHRAQQVADFGRGHALRAAAEFVDHGAVIVQRFGQVLREIAHDDLVADDALARGEVVNPGEHPDHGRFAGAVGTDQCDPRAAFDLDADAAIDREFAVPFDCVAQFDHAPRAAIAIRKLDRGRLLQPHRRLQPFDFFELLDTALDQLGLACLVAEAADEGLHVFDFDALLFVRRKLGLETAHALDQVK